MTETGVEAEFALEEPSLSYHRLGNDLLGSCAENEITIVAAHWKFIVLGHKDGTVNIFDHLGNLVQNGFYKKHFCPINQISISDDDNFVATCADDGFVFIYSLSEPEHGELLNLNRPIKALAISPNYSKTRKLITGGKSVRVGFGLIDLVWSVADTLDPLTNSSIPVLFNELLSNITQFEGERESDNEPFDS
ncbi:unnamed protein product [Hydatigera taeniaeformis]|uniref:WD_REPEATS_REGION domain-containing protein n=1 Tax=Hydatigena taeniaeformis TaxID=6205 RepID=A0A0R3WWS8_HYDTA|nr:unnamed protein product [Hydatigera taeniaeformis]